ncbi:GATOR1 complex protein NPRL3-like isoform X4 [Ambystoma mexicanum]|uniref:GATOR1 complex protein NPRL3-like isoform X4 n=1 Tax=Ambystoma mexicanum TaxID=8296 RepID=UPI0037E9A35F
MRNTGFRYRCVQSCQGSARCCPEALPPPAFRDGGKQQPHQRHSGKPRSRYALNHSGDNTDDQDGDSRFSDILATILATKSDMCGQKFELKIDNVRFVGHPTLLQHALGQEGTQSFPAPRHRIYNKD